MQKWNTDDELFKIGRKPYEYGLMHSRNLV